MVYFLFSIPPSSPKQTECNEKETKLEEILILFATGIPPASRQHMNTPPKQANNCQHIHFCWFIFAEQQLSAKQLYWVLRVTILEASTAFYSNNYCFSQQHSMVLFQTLKVFLCNLPFKKTLESRMKMLNFFATQKCFLNIYFT